MGNPSELGYLQKALQRQAAHASATRTEQDDDDKKKPLVLVHSAVCNDGRTSDGIVAGGSRLAAEVNEWVQAVLQKMKNADDTTNNKATSMPLSLSFIGNSLGGLYARYALSEIDWQQDDGDLQPAVFCTTATPHLGVSTPHNYVRVPTRWAEYGVATVLGQTGLDLFRFSPDIIQDMTVLPKFTRPLARFRHRIAYANAHNTDFQVPCSTAAFLSKTNNSVHKRVVVVEEPTTSPSLSAAIALTVTTEPRRDDEQPKVVESEHITAADSSSSSEQQQQQPLSSDDLALMLDRMGWTKVFCDVRPHLPGIPIPFQSSSPSSSTQTSSSTTTKDEYTSSELWDEFANFLSQNNKKLHAPFGHTILVANSKNDFYASLNSAGQPVMDELAAHLVEQILLQQTEEQQEQVTELGKTQDPLLEQGCFK